MLSLLALVQLRADRQAGVGLPGPLPPAHHALADLPFAGINVALDPYDAADRALALQAIQADGFGWVRQRFDWGALEPQPGVFDWTQSDAILHSIDAAGLTPIVVLDGSPAWARATQDTGAGDNPLAPPARVEDFARFAAAFARRYAASVRIYQLWDEPNVAPHWGNRWIDPVGYAQLLKAAAIAVRQADPDAVILLAALAPTADRGHLAQDEVYFLQRLYAAGAQPYFDAVAIQPFGFGYAPEDAQQQADVLNFQRAAWVRRAMLAAGDAQTPMLAVRFGWNRRLNSPWGTVTPDTQALFARQALDLAYTRWPWLSGMGWAIYRSAAPPSDPAWGFSLNRQVADAVAGWERTRPEPAAAILAFPPVRPDWARWALLLLATALGAWRLPTAAQRLPWRSWQHLYCGQTPPVRAGIWLALLVAYYLAVWPPLIVLLWVIAALLILAEPRAGLWLAAALLPFYFQHKDVAWGQLAFAVPPTHAAALCLLPALLLHARRTRRPLDRWDALALSWAALVVLSAFAVWYWPAYWRGIVDLVAVPLILYAAVRALAPTDTARRRVLMALAGGGLLAATLGLLGWLRGGGEADAMRRLAGLAFSPNHTALYLERTLFLALGLALVQRGKRRWLWLGAALGVGGALALTGSRGALLLGLPAGLLLFGLYAARRGVLRSAVRALLRPGALALVLSVTAFAVVLLANGLSWERLTNRATLLERGLLWRQSWQMARDFWLTGVGPGGFLWLFPAYIPPGAPLDPNLQHPHNVWLEHATSSGIAGLLWLFAALTLVINAVRRAGEKPRHALGWEQIGLLAAFAAALAHAQVDAFAALPDLAAWNWLALGLLAASLPSARREPPAP